MKLIVIIVLRTFLVVMFAPATVAIAQDNPLTTHSKFTFSATKKILLSAAEKMPEEQYGFKPAESVRTFGQIVAHVADASYRQCAAVLGDKTPMPNIEKTKTAKADLIGALNEAFAYCDKAYDGMTDATGKEMLKSHSGNESPKLGMLHISQIHNIEHYGNLIVYLRMKNIVPPTSDPEFMKSLTRR